THRRLIGNATQRLDQPWQHVGLEEGWQEEPSQATWQRRKLLSEDRQGQGRTGNRGSAGLLQTRKEHRRRRPRQQGQLHREVPSKERQSGGRRVPRGCRSRCSGASPYIPAVRTAQYRPAVTPAPHSLLRASRAGAPEPTTDAPAPLAFAPGPDALTRITARALRRASAQPRAKANPPHTPRTWCSPSSNVESKVCRRREAPV